MVLLKDLRSAAELNGELGITLKFNSDAGRWLVRLSNGEGKSVRPANLESGESGDWHGRVMAFWGDAQWSRAQLLGEIARGSWGMCRATISDLASDPHLRRRKLDGRLAFAPITEMSEDYVRNAQVEMKTLRATAQAATPLAEAGEEEEEEEEEEALQPYVPAFMEAPSASNPAPDAAAADPPERTAAETAGAEPNAASCDAVEVHSPRAHIEVVDVACGEVLVAAPVESNQGCQPEEGAMNPAGGEVDHRPAAQDEIPS